MRTTALRGIGHTLAAFSTNCSEFQRAWGNRDGSKQQLATRWIGEWSSEVNGHRGELRCLLVRLSENRLRASFHARYAKFLRVCYSVDLNARTSGDRLTLKGEADLGQLAGGTYYYEGESDGRRIVCKYSCSYDHGTFRLDLMDYSS
jgi:hypothetical protein